MYRGNLPCDLNGGSFTEYGIKYATGESMTTGGKRFESTNRGTAEFSLSNEGKAEDTNIIAASPVF